MDADVGQSEPEKPGPIERAGTTSKHREPARAPAPKRDYANQQIEYLTGEVRRLTEELAALRAKAEPIGREHARLEEANKNLRKEFKRHNWWVIIGTAMGSGGGAFLSYHTSDGVGRNFAFGVCVAGILILFWQSVFDLVFAPRD